MIAVAYTTWGRVRGMGPIRADRAAADLDLDEDRSACRRQRGYSDRALCLIDVDGVLHYEDGRTVWPAHGRGCGAVRISRGPGAPTSRLTDLQRRSVRSQHPHAAATRDTTPWHIWHAAVIEIAGVSVDEARAAARARIQSWYQAGEPAWMAADALLAFVRGARGAAREDDGREAIRAAHRASVSRRGT